MSFRIVLAVLIASGGAWTGLGLSQILWAASGTALPGQAQFPTTNTNANDATTCSSGSDERILAIAVTGDGCELTYTKGGESKSVAHQKEGLSVCERVKEQIEKRLQASGFKCK
ncbi:MAG: hypothetical protein AABZ55_07490 [Bdellovibrionota bacterium]